MGYMKVGLFKGLMALNDFVVIFQERDPLDEYNQTFVISEAAHWDSQQQFKKTKPIAIKETDVGEGWVRVELAWAVRVWLEGMERLHTLHVACRTCQVSSPSFTISY